MKNIFPEGTLANKLADQIPDEPPKPKERQKLNIVRYTPGGTSSVRETSIRGKVFAAVKEVGDDGISVTDLNEKMGFDTRLYLHKLAEKNHIEDLS